LFLRLCQPARLVVAPLLLGAVLASAVAHAEPTEADRATARSLASEGYDALERKDYETAVNRFRHADALVHAPTISVDLARALIGMGRYVEAYERYQLVIREGVPKGAPASWKRALEDAEQEVQAIEPRLGWVVIHVMGPLDPHATIDGVEVPEASLGARRAADPGERTVRASAPGFEPASQTITLEEGEEEVVTLVLKRSPTPRSDDDEQDQAPAPTKPQEESSLLPVWIAFGVGGAGVVVGSVTGILALSAHSELAERCPTGKCYPRDDAEARDLRSDLSRYHTFGTISGVGFALGIAGAATGTVLFLTERRSDTPAAGIRVWPVLGAREVGVAGRF
jgi:hypothetical protein